MDLITKRQEVTTKDAASFWKISDRAARVRLKKMVEEGLVAEISTHTLIRRRNLFLNREAVAKMLILKMLHLFLFETLFFFFDGL